jgi:hypothetical protein
MLNRGLNKLAETLNWKNWALKSGHYPSTSENLPPSEANILEEADDDDGELPQGSLKDLTRAAMLRMPHGQRRKFRIAEAKELKAIEDLKVIEGMVPIPKGVRPIATRFVYATKGQTAIFRWLMMIALVLHLYCDHVDVNTAFLYATLSHPMYITGAPGRLCPAGYCLKVVKALCGCREAPREWYHCLRDEIVDEMEFIQSALDPCLFIRFPGLPTIQLIYIYVDDILVFCADQTLLDTLKAKIKARFAIKDLGAVKRYLGVWVDMNPDFSGLFLHQTDYCIKVLETFKHWFSMFLTPRTTPLPASFHELIAAETEPIDPSDFNYDWLIMFP